MSESKGSSVISALGVEFRFLNSEFVKGNLGRKSRPNFALFDPLSKI